LLDHYRIVGVLGHGGMGVVYRATDTKLDRPVAIKFLGEQLLDGAAQQRFKREAEIAASLNHPHIVTVYDVATRDGHQYIVSELVDGGTLDSWAAAARRSWRQKVELMTGVADALAATHAAGVLHRDIKPGNILIGSNGYAKLADFGLALRGATAISQGVVTRQTAVGFVVGTVAYMSPEQTSGQALDERSDVFSFGVVLYELLAGRRPFDGSTDLEVLKAIAQAPYSPLPETLPEPLRAIVDKALEKDPADRYQSMRELVVDLKRVARKAVSGQQTATPSSATPRRWFPVSVVLAVALAAVLVAGVLLLLKQKAPPVRAVRFDMAVPASTGDLALSPNGQTLAYAADAAGGERALFVRTVGAITSKEVPNSERASQPFWSPDGRALVFETDLALKRIDVAGTGSPVLLARSAGAMGGTWSSEGTILFSSMASAVTRDKAIGVIGSVGINGGDVVARTAAQDPNSKTFHYRPTMLPDGRHYLFVDEHQPTADAPYQDTISMGSLDSAEVEPLVALGETTGTGRVLLGYANGWLMYTKRLTLLAQRLDLRAAKVAGDPVTVAEGVNAFALAGDVLAFRQDLGPAVGAAPASELRWYGRDGTPLEAVGVPSAYGGFELTRDARRLVVADGGDIWVHDLVRNVSTRLTFEPDRQDVPSWSPDNSDIVFASGRGHTDFTKDLYRRAANGSGGEELLYAGEGGNLLTPAGWSADGRELLLSILPLGKAVRQPLWRLTLSNKQAEPIIESRASIVNANLSPNGHWLAYATDASGVFEVVVQPYPNLTQGKWQISVRGGDEPRWRSDGKELFFVAADGTLNAVTVDADAAAGTFTTGAPIGLFRANLTRRLYNRLLVRYDVAPDGQRFLMSVRAPSSATAGAEEAAVHVVVNWTATLLAN
jgi:Tol biopolymer transport system component